MPDGYTAAGGVYLYASEEIETLKALRRRGQDIDTGTVWIGYVGYSEAAKDIVVAWRGTHQAFEWVKDAE